MGYYGLLRDITIVTKGYNHGSLQLPNGATHHGSQGSERIPFCHGAPPRLAREDLKEIRGCNTDSCNFNGGAWGSAQLGLGQLDPRRRRRQAMTCCDQVR